MKIVVLGLNAQVFVNGEIKVLNLMCRVVKERHLAANIQKWLKEAQDEYGISNNQLLTFTIDSASNMTKAVNDHIKTLDEEERLEEVSEDEGVIEEEGTVLPLHDEIDENEDIVETYDNQNDSEELPFALTLPATRIHYAVHRLQLGVNDFLRQDKFNRVVVIAQKLTAKLRTPTARILLKKENLKSPLMFQETRWSSTFNMLDRLLELKDFCEQNQSVWKGIY